LEEGCRANFTSIAEIARLLLMMKIKRGEDYFSMPADLFIHASGSCNE